MPKSTMNKISFKINAKSDSAMLNYNGEQKKNSLLYTCALRLCNV